MPITYISYDELIEKDTEEQFIHKHPCDICCLDQATCRAGSSHRYQGCNQGLFVNIPTGTKKKHDHAKELKAKSNREPKETHTHT